MYTRLQVYDIYTADLIWLLWPLSGEPDGNVKTLWFKRLFYEPSQRTLFTLALSSAATQNQLQMNDFRCSKVVWFPFLFWQHFWVKLPPKSTRVCMKTWPKLCHLVFNALKNICHLLTATTSLSDMTRKKNSLLLLKVFKSNFFNICVHTCARRLLSGCKVQLLFPPKFSLSCTQLVCHHLGLPLRKRHPFRFTRDKFKFKHWWRPFTPPLRNDFQFSRV